MNLNLLVFNLKLILMLKRRKIAYLFVKGYLWNYGADFKINGGEMVLLSPPPPPAPT